jgi:hypothetical protein
MSIKFYTGDEFPENFFDALGIPRPVIVPVRADEKLCTFCGKPVSFVTMTEGRGPLKFKHVLDMVDDTRVGVPPTAVEKVVISSAKLIACPGCVDKIEPTVDKGGSVKNNIKFRSEL